MDDDKKGVPDGWEVVTATAAPEPSKGHDFKVLGMNVHVPAEEKPRLDSNIAGWGTEGSGVAPEDVLMGGMAARGVAAAGKAGGALAATKEAVIQAAPMVKYEAVKSGLMLLHVPEPLAMAAAMAVSGYKKGAKPAGVSAPSAPDSPHLDLSTRVPAGALSQQEIGERLAAARTQGMSAPAVEPQTSPRPSPSSVPAMPPKPAPVEEPAPTKAPSPARIANDLGIAARRAGVKLTAADDADVLLRISKGADPTQAIADVIAGKTLADPAAELARRLGTPSDAERTFAPNKSGLPTKPGYQGGRPK